MDYFDSHWFKVLSELKNYLWSQTYKPLMKTSWREQESKAGRRRWDWSGLSMSGAVASSPAKTAWVARNSLFFSPWGWEEGTGNNGSREKLSFKVQVSLGFIISWFLFQSKSNLNPDAKEFIPGVKYWADRKLWGGLVCPHIWGQRCTNMRRWRGGGAGGVHSGEGTVV